MCTKSHSSSNASMDAGWNNSVIEFQHSHIVWMWYYFACMSPSYQGRSQPRISGGAPASGRWARGWVHANGCLPFQRGGTGVATHGIFVYFNTISCILVHSLATKMGTTSVFIKTSVHWGKWRLLEEAAEWGANGRQSRPKVESWVGFLGRVKQAPPARGVRQWCKQDQILETKTKITRPRPRPLLTRQRPK